MAPAVIPDIDDFGVDDFNDPFADSGDEQGKTDSQSNKRKQPDGLGIEEAVAVTKKPRAPNVKLDEDRLLSDKGIPKLRRKARDLKFKGKGHEVCVLDSLESAANSQSAVLRYIPLALILPTLAG